MKDNSILTLDLLIEKLKSLRATYNCGNYTVKIKNEKDLENFTADNFYIDPKDKEFVIDQK